MTNVGASSLGLILNYNKATYRRYWKTSYSLSVATSQVLNSPRWTLASVLERAGWGLLLWQDTAGQLRGTLAEELARSLVVKGHLYLVTVFVQLAHVLGFCLKLGHMMVKVDPCGGRAGLGVWERSAQALWRWGQLLLPQPGRHLQGKHKFLCPTLC